MKSILIFTSKNTGYSINRCIQLTYSKEALAFALVADALQYYHRQPS